MKKICLSIAQMRKLSELGISTKDASMCWIRDDEGSWTAVIHDEYCYEMSFMNPIPAFTLEDILNIMPDSIFSEVYSKNFRFKMEKIQNNYKLFYWNLFLDNIVSSTYQENAIDAVFQVLCWLAENKLFKMKEYMAWLAVDKSSVEIIFYNRPKRANEEGYPCDEEKEQVQWVDGGNYVLLPQGSVKKLLGRDLKWEDEPVKLN